MTKRRGDDPNAAEAKRSRAIPWHDRRLIIVLLVRVRPGPTWDWDSATKSLDSDISEAVAERHFSPDTFTKIHVGTDGEGCLPGWQINDPELLRELLRRREEGRTEFQISSRPDDAVGRRLLFEKPGDFVSG